MRDFFLWEVLLIPTDLKKKMTSNFLVAQTMKFINQSSYLPSTNKVICHEISEIQYKIRLVLRFFSLTSLRQRKKKKNFHRHHVIGRRFFADILHCIVLQVPRQYDGKNF